MSIFFFVILLPDSNDAIRRQINWLFSAHPRQPLIIVNLLKYHPDKDGILILIRFKTIFWFIECKKAQKKFPLYSLILLRFILELFRALLLPAFILSDRFCVFSFYRCYYKAVSLILHLNPLTILPRSLIFISDCFNMIISRYKFT